MAQRTALGAPPQRRVGPAGPATRLAWFVMAAARLDVPHAVFPGQAGYP
jgi:hypothetical protein